jgi:hypothetical protein
MWKSLIVLAVIFLAACARQHTMLPFSLVLRGEIEEPLRVSVSGKMDTSGISFYSLIQAEDSLGSANCIALILTDSDQARAEQLHGHSVLVRGRILYLADLIQMIPSQRGQINGRDWAGTACEGEVAIYVTRLEAITTGR